MVTTEATTVGNRKGNPLVYYLRTLLYLFMAALIRLVALLPLAALFIFPAGSLWRWLALISPMLLVFVVLPLRFSFAQALVQPQGERRFSFDRALSLSGYGQKLGESLLHALHIAKWGIPLYGMAAFIVYVYYETDLISLMRSLSDMGAGLMAVLCAVGNFFIGIFGGTQLVPNGGLMEGFYLVCAALGVGVLILLWGMVRNGAYRYIWVQVENAEKNPHAEARRRLRGRRLAQLDVAAVNLLLLAPALYVVLTTLTAVLGNVSDALFTFMSTQHLSLPEWSSALLPLLFAFLVCYMPLLPLRRFLTCWFATHSVRTATVQTAEQPVAAEYYRTTSSGATQPAAEAYGVQMTVGHAYTPNATTEEETEIEPEVRTVPMPAYRPAHAAVTQDVMFSVKTTQPETASEAAQAERATTQSNTAEDPEDEPEA